MTERLRTIERTEHQSNAVSRRAAMTAGGAFIVSLLPDLSSEGARLKTGRLYRNDDYTSDISVEGERRHYPYDWSVLEMYLGHERRLNPQNTHTDTAEAIGDGMADRTARLYCAEVTGRHLDPVADLQRILQALQTANRSPEELRFYVECFAQELLRSGWKYKEESHFHDGIAPKKYRKKKWHADCDMIVAALLHAAYRHDVGLAQAESNGHAYACRTRGPDAYELTGIRKYGLVDIETTHRRYRNDDLREDGGPHYKGYYRPQKDYEVRRSAIGQVICGMREKAGEDFLRLANVCDVGYGETRKYGPQNTLGPNAYLAGAAAMRRYRCPDVEGTLQNYEAAIATQERLKDLKHRFASALNIAADHDQLVATIT